jgi:hypothetical protein
MCLKLCCLNVVFYLNVEYEHKVPVLTRGEFDNAARYNILTNWWLADEIMR